MENSPKAEAREVLDAIKSWLINLSVGAAVVGIFQGIWWGVLVAFALLATTFFIVHLKQEIL